MIKEDLKIGYIVKIRNGKFGMIMENSDKDMKILYKTQEVSTITEDLKSKWEEQYDIMEVYGYNEYFVNALEFTSEDRELLWERKEVKNMTVKQIEDVLGYKINIVAELNGRKV